MLRFFLWVLMIININWCCLLGIMLSEIFCLRVFIDVFLYYKMFCYVRLNLNVVYLGINFD